MLAHIPNRLNKDVKLEPDQVIEVRSDFKLVMCELLVTNPNGAADER